MKSEDELDLLKKVARMDAPPFLLTRIQAKIRASASEQLPTSWKWAGALSIGLLLFFNVFALKTSKTTATAPVELIAQSLHLQPSNQLYDE